MSNNLKTNCKHTCGVPQCSQRRTKGVSLHKIPNFVLGNRKLFLALKMGKPVPKYFSICSRHFREEQILRTNQEGAGIRRYGRLLDSAFPTLNLPKDSLIVRKANLIKARERRIRIQRRGIIPNTFMEEQGFPQPKRLRPEKITSFPINETATPSPRIKQASSLCLTCLSNVEEGAILTKTLQNFLCDVLHFKTELLESPKIICRKCYKTLIELKCFYTQLRDVEVYFESKIQVDDNYDPNDFIERHDTEEPFIGESDCIVSIADDFKQDPILIDENEECCIVEDENALKQNKNNASDIATGKRFVCLTCSKLFGSYVDLRAHEKTHSLSTIQKASPVFVAANTQVAQKFSCPECAEEFFNKFILEAHMRKHKQVRPFYCKSCEQRFAKRDRLVAHESKYKCLKCQNRCCSRKALQVHIKEKHNGRMIDTNAILKSVSAKKEYDEQLDDNNTADSEEP